MTTTPLQIIRRALEHLNVQESGQQVATEDGDIGLRALVSMLDAWQLDPQATIGLQEFVYQPSGGQQTVTIGPTGQIVGTMPVRIEPASFYRVGGIDRSLGIANSLEEYTAQANKSFTGLASFARYERGNNGVGTLYLYPAAEGTEVLHLWARQDVVLGYASLGLATPMTLPNGYQNAMEWCLASELSSDFAINSQADVERKASIAYRRLKRANFVSAQMQAPPGVTRARGFLIQNGT